MRILLISKLKNCSGKKDNTHFFCLYLQENSNGMFLKIVNFYTVVPLLFLIIFCTCKGLVFSSEINSVR